VLHIAEICLKLPLSRPCLHTVPYCLMVDVCDACAQSAEARHTSSVSALKAGWAAELKRQKELWEAGQAAKQGAWQTAKTAEIKEQTVKVSIVVDNPVSMCCAAASPLSDQGKGHILGHKDCCAVC